MRKWKFLAAIVLLLLGAGALAFGILGRARYDDPFAFSDADLGKTVTIVLSEPMPVVDGNDQNWLLYYETDAEEPLELWAKVPESMQRDFKRYAERGVPVTGVLQQGTQEMHDAAYDCLIAYLEMVTEYVEDYEISDEEREAIHGYISPYYLEVTAVNEGMMPTLKRIACIAGGVLLLAALIVLIAAISGKAIWKIALICLLILLIPAAIVCIVYFNKIRTLCSIRADDEGVYYMEHYGDYDLDGMLAANITTDDELAEWLRKEEYCNLPVTLDTDRFACAAFKAKTPDGDVLLGRNFDYPETDTVMVYSRPKNGYASYAVADLEVMGISTNSSDDAPDSLTGRFLMLGAPYVVCDGMNDAGLGVSTLELEIGELHQDTGKPDLYVYMAIRLLLDRCATVDEAVDMLKQYDVHSHADVRQHLFIADKSGRSVVVEWIGEEMFVNELDAVTNSVVTPGELYDKGADDRLPKLSEVLTESGGVRTAEQARDLLDAVSQRDFTEYSCVYNLSKFSVDLYVDEDFDRAYYYGAGK